MVKQDVATSYSSVPHPFSSSKPKNRMRRRRLTQTSSLNNEHILPLLEDMTKGEREALILDLKGDRAKVMVDIMYQLIMNPRSILVKASLLKVSKPWIRKMINRLRILSGHIPTGLFLDGVTFDDTRISGLGGFADVFQGQYQSATIAVKRLKVYTNEGKSADEVSQGLYREAIIWIGLRHHFVLPLLGVFALDNSTSCLVTPWMKNGTIRTAISRLKRQPEICQYATLGEQLTQWFAEIAYGLKYLHSEDIIHGDLRGANILIDDDWTVRLADFGLATFAHEASRAHGSTRAGNPRWLAPEIVYQHNGSCRPTLAADVYSLACVGIEIFTNASPFREYSFDAAVIAALGRGKRPTRPEASGHTGGPIPDDLWNLMQSCWSESPAQRPNAASVCQAIASCVPALVLPTSLGQGAVESDSVSSASIFFFLR